jgi:hypothetical protein
MRSSLHCREQACINSCISESDSTRIGTIQQKKSRKKVNRLGKSKEVEDTQSTREKNLVEVQQEHYDGDC